MKRALCCLLLTVCLASALPARAALLSPESVYGLGEMKPRDSALRVKVGDMAPDFALPALGGATVRLSDYRGKKNVVLSFVPAAFTPVCSDQWPGYNLARPLFEKRDTVLLGITTDNLPSLHAWTLQMGGVWFPVLSDFWPHGRVAGAYGVLRGDGMAERALVVIDRKGVIRSIDVNDINRRPELGELIRRLDALR
ncbi:MAG TPA: peroxiredoxin [Desulfovibrio sp.]|uniref:peroxiredoxin n=1 Tax=Desulfovibrio sp. TaxID=885 RepID=UPI002C4F368B|nr:peroxiredoxin [Desulfovibrio sp.]HMM37461.1 peroxiredoxin [Desulfovibrio sp.]